MTEVVNVPQFDFVPGRIFALKKKAQGSGHVWKEFKAEFNSNETEDDVMIEWNNNGRKRMFPRTTDTTTKVTISLMLDYTLQR